MQWISSFGWEDFVVAMRDAHQTLSSVVSSERRTCGYRRCCGLKYSVVVSTVATEVDARETSVWNSESPTPTGSIELAGSLNVG